jgi:signal transduction histidine kinase
MLQRERQRIARDIHDDLTSRLTELVLLGEVAQSDLPDQSPPREQFNAISEKARSLLKAMNEIVWVVNSQRDTLRDFVSYTTKHAQTFFQSTPIRCRFDIGAELSSVPLELGIRRNLFLAVKEALCNVVKHSNAAEVCLRIHQNENVLSVMVEDNGTGFELSERDSQRNGISNMSQRSAEAGGTCIVESSSGSGCRVQFIVPLAGPARAGRRWRWPRLHLRRSRKEAESISVPLVSVSPKSVTDL